MKKVIITGGAGFIGHHFVNYILENTKADIVVVDNLCNGEFERINFNERVKLINCSASEIKKYEDHLKDSDYIFHMACVQISKSSDIPHIDLETNAVSTLNILEYLKNNKTSLKRFVYTSSCSIYGQSEILPITETFSPNISSIYAATKYLGENYTNLYHKLYKIPISIIRYSNVYGPGQTPEKKVCGVIGKFIYETLNDIPIVVYGNGEHKRDYSYIDDVIESTYIISKTEKTLGETYNISSNTNYSVNDIVKIIKSNLYQTKVNFKPPRIIDNINNRLISSDKLNRDTGWAPIHSIENGVEKTIQYFKIKMKKNK